MVLLPRGQGTTTNFIGLLESIISQSLPSSISLWLSVPRTAAADFAELSAHAQISLPPTRAQTAREPLGRRELSPHSPRRARSGGFRNGVTDRVEWNVMVNMSQTFSSQSGFFGTDDIVKRIFSDTFLDRSHPSRSVFFAIG